MAKSDCVVIWGTNPVNTQVNVMTHAVRARKERGAKIVVVDIYRTATMEQADMGLVLRPGSDGALALAWVGGWLSLIFPVLVIVVASATPAAIFVDSLRSGRRLRSGPSELAREAAR